MRVAVTGAMGFTGRFVTEALQAAGTQVMTFSADLTDRDAVEQAVADSSFDCVIHLAGHAFVGASDWSTFYEVNQLGTFNLLDAIARRQPGTRCVLASSAQVYGPGAEGLLGENAPANPANHYAISKYAMEHGARLWRDRLEIVITRPFNYTGAGQSPEYLIPKIVNHFRRAEPVIELGNTWVKRDFGDVRSVAQAYVGLATTKNVPQVVNICTGAIHSVDEILNMLSAISGRAIDVKINAAFVRSNDVPVLGGNPSLLRSALQDWRPHDLRETLEWMYGLA